MIILEFIVYFFVEILFEGIIMKFLRFLNKKLTAIYRFFRKLLN